MGRRESQAREKDFTMPSTAASGSNVSISSSASSNSASRSKSLSPDHNPGRERRGTGQDRAIISMYLMPYSMREGFPESGPPQRSFTHQAKDGCVEGCFQEGDETNT